MKRKLAIELVPSTMWGKNYRNLAPRGFWQELRMNVMKNRCDICGSLIGPFHCHEKWNYVIIDNRYIQQLTGLECCCINCHNVHHAGRSLILAAQGAIDKKLLVAHYCTINGCTPSDWKSDYHEAYIVWKERSMHSWILDVASIVPKDLMCDLT